MHYLVIDRKRGICMSNKSLLNEFNIQKKETSAPVVSDYAVFPDKAKLDSLRTKIVQNLINNQIPSNVSLEQYINDEIDSTLEDYDLGAVERAHIFNLIQISLYVKWFIIYWIFIFIRIINIIIFPFISERNWVFDFFLNYYSSKIVLFE